MNAAIITSANFLPTAQQLTYRQLQQLCKRAREMGYINKGFKVNQKRSILENMAAAIYLRLNQAQA